MTELSEAERKTMLSALTVEINAAFARGTSGGPERVFEAAWLAARDYYRNADDFEITEQAIDRLREADRLRKALQEITETYSLNEAPEIEDNRLRSLARAILGIREERDV